MPYPDDMNAPTADIESAIEEAMQILKDAAASDGQVTANERLVIEKITTLAQQLLATREKEHQAALGGGPATNFLKRMSGGA